MSPVRYEVDGSTATLTFDSPENRNAMTPQLLEGLLDGLTRAEGDGSVRAVVLTHTGNVFCAGADLKGQSSTSSGDTGESEKSKEVILRERGTFANGVVRKLVSCSKPVIAAIHGHVRAGGMGFVAACDVVIAGPKATFGLSEVRIGVVAAMIAPSVLSRLDGRTAAEWFLRGHVSSAEEAAQVGFISRAVDGAGVTVDEAVEEVLVDLRAAAPRALAASKKLVNRDVLARIDRESEEMIELSGSFFGAEDARAGMAAFFEKKSPPWVVDR